MQINKKGATPIVVALFAAIISAGCFIHIPVPGSTVPIVLQDMLAMLSGLLLGPVYGALAVVVFLVLGCLGLPVFSGKAGINILLQGPTGGFLVGYLVASIAGGLFLALTLDKCKNANNTKTYALIALASIFATVLTFVCGIIGFMRVTHSDLAKTFAAVLVPFIPGNVLKIVLMVFITKKFRPIIKRYFS